MLRRLTDKGAVSASGEPSVAQVLPVTERMFCFYFNLLRKRNQDAVIRRFIAFMAAFYDLSGRKRWSLPIRTRETLVLQNLVFASGWNVGFQERRISAWSGAAARSVPRAGCLLQLGDFQAAEALVHEWLPGIAEIEGDRGKFLRWWAACVLFQCWHLQGQRGGNRCAWFNGGGFRTGC